MYYPHEVYNKTQDLPWSFLSRTRRDGVKDVLMKCTQYRCNASWYQSYVAKTVHVPENKGHLDLRGGVLS